MKYKFTGDWQEFERIVAAIHSAEMAGAEVKLNEEISGREFDVAVRFKSGFHSYLTLIECKRYSSRVPAEKVDAFVTKSRDAKANKALMFSSNGYQAGAVEVAKRHSVDLFTIHEEIRVPEEIKAGGTTDGLNIRNVAFRTGPSEMELPHENGRLEYLMRQSILSCGKEQVSLEEFVHARVPKLFEQALRGQDKSTDIALPPKTTLTAPGLCSDRPVDTIRVTYQIVEMVNLKPEAPRMDGHLFEKLHTFYCLKNEVTGESQSIMALGVHLGFDTKLAAGCYYSNPNLGNNYYVERIDGTKATIYLIESYGQGKLIQAVYIQDLKYESQFVLIKDDSEIARLSKLYRRMKRRQKN